MGEGSQRVVADPFTAPLPVRPGSSSPRQLRNRLRVSVLVGDVLILLLTTFLAWPLLGTIGAFDATAAVIVPIYLGTALNSRAYFIDVLCDGLESVSAALKSLIFAYGVLFLVLYFLRTQEGVPRIFLFATMFGSVVLLTLYRLGIATLIERRWSDRLIATLLIRDGASCAGALSVPTIDAAGYGLSNDLSDPANLNRFAELTRDVDRIVIACPPESQRAWAMMLKGANVQGEVIVDNIGETGAFGIGKIGDQDTLVVAAGPLTLTQRLFKRAFDIALCVPAIIALAPVLIVTAIAIKLDSRGPVFFRQRRVGRGNAFFEILKFRSMHVESSDAEGSVSTAGRHDKRVTRVGRFIRSTSIDELPQLFNVLGGSMSLVGPRPHALGSLAGSQLFWEVDHRYWHRHACKPGLTGLAQIRGFRGATHRREDLVNRLQADLEYLNGWSIWRDVSILVATTRVVIHRNAF